MYGQKDDVEAVSGGDEGYIYVKVGCHKHKLETCWNILNWNKYSVDGSISPGLPQRLRLVTYRNH